ncbi:hypothetical protein H9P43_000489 [Blastocladiella emersonii ATCC 22665]|nr:hypothetical protein H9P43_000489 [Blastocladiella emersonii ATCC 22665]
MRVVFVQIAELELLHDPPKLVFVRVGVAGGNALRTDVAAEPSLTPRFQLTRFHFKLTADAATAAPATGAPGEPPAAAAKSMWGAGRLRGSKVANRPAAGPAAPADPLVTLELFELAADGPILAAKAEAHASALVEGGPALQLLDAAHREPVGSVKAVARLLESKDGRVAAAPSAADEEVEGAAEEGAETRRESPEDEHLPGPGLCGKRVVLTVVAIRNAHAFKNQSIHLALMQGTAVKAKCPPFLVSSDTVYLSQTFGAVVDSHYSGTTLVTLAVLEKDKARVKFPIPLPGAALPSLTQVPLTLKLDVLELAVLLTCTDLAAPTLASLAPHYPTHTMGLVHLHIRETSVPLPVRGRCILHTTCLVDHDAFLADMLGATKPCALPRFPVLAFDHTGCGNAWATAYQTNAHQPEKYAVSQSTRAAVTGAPFKWNHHAVVPVTTARLLNARAELVFRVYVLLGNEYQLFGYASLPLAPVARGEAAEHRVRVFPTPVFQSQTGRQKIYLHVDVRVQVPRGAAAAAAAASAGMADDGEHGDESVDLPALEPAQSTDLANEFQDMANAIMELRIEKRRLQVECGQMEQRLEDARSAASLPAGYAESLPHEELVHRFAQLQAAFKALESAPGRIGGGAVQNRAPGAAGSASDEVKDLQQVLAQQQLQLQELEVSRKKMERLKRLAKQQEQVIQKLEALVASHRAGPGQALPATSSFLGHGSDARPPPNPLPNPATGTDAALYLRCTKAEARVVALEKQLEAVTLQLARSRMPNAGR